MIRFLAKRLAMMLGILLTLSILVYSVLDLALDPMDDLRMSTALNKEELVAARRAMLNLDDPWFVRYFSWLGDFVRGDLGMAWRSQQLVVDQLGPAAVTSIQLIFFASITATLLGTTVGLISALRQYTTFDYIITFVAFLLFSLPVFWVAVLLKQFLAIGMNDYLENPEVPWVGIAVFSVVAGLFWTAAVGGTLVRRAITFGIAAVATFGLLAYALGGGWLQNPRPGILGVILVGLGAAVVATATVAGLRNRRALGAALTTFGVGVIMYQATLWLFYYVEANTWWVLGLFALAIGLAIGIGWLWGGPDRAVSQRGAAIVAVVMSLVVYIDLVFARWGSYITNSEIRGRPIATIGPSTPNLTGDYWLMQLDKFTHLLLPSIALILISFASYTRYERGAMLEVLNQDYIRTARAKGLSERVVIVRHALRNALLPLASIIPVDLLVMVGGAAITETIFGWSGMGKLFIDSLRNSEVDPLMAYIVIIGALAMVANLVADFFYAVLDPRIRVNA